MAHAHAIGFSLSAREPMDVSRIAACAGTIAINVALILLLLAPLSGRLPDLPSSAKDPVLVLWQPPRPKIVEPPVPVPVLPQPQTATIQPVRQPQHVAPVDTPVVDPQSGDIAIEPPDIAPGPEPTLDPVPSSGEQLQALRSPPPPYPAEAMRNGLSGVVELEIRAHVEDDAAFQRHGLAVVAGAGAADGDGDAQLRAQRDDALDLLLGAGTHHGVRRLAGQLALEHRAEPGEVLGQALDARRFLDPLQVGERDVQLFDGMDRCVHIGWR